MSIQFADATLAKPVDVRKAPPAPARTTTPPSRPSAIIMEVDDDQTSAVRGIIIAVLISLPLWALLGAAIFMLL